MITLYAILDLPPSASAQVIKERYRELARTKHPDLGGDTDEFARITHAGSVLTDKIRKADYDAWLRLMCDPCPSCEGRGTREYSISFTRRVARRCDTCKGKGFYGRVKNTRA
jgi:DnaJ-class molecular chaperone